MRFGQDSIALLKPEDNGGLMQPEAEGAQEGGGGSMIVYDIVDDDGKKNKTKA